MAVQRRTIGRLPVARGKWNSSDTYYKYNVVSNDGSSFMSVKEDSFSGSNYEPTVELDGTNFKIYFGGTLQDGTNDVWQLMSYGRDANLSVRYVECDSAAGSNKTLTITGFELTTNMRYLIKMDNINTVDNATLNISGTGAKPIMYNGSPASSTNSWIAGEVLDVYYDGTNFVAITFGGAKFMTGERLDTVGIDYEPIEDSNDLITSGAVATALKNVAYKDGYYEQMAVGLSKNLIQPIDVNNKFLFRPTATELGLNIDEVNEVSNGLSYVKGIEGNAVAWNQLVTNGDFSNGTTGWDADYAGTMNVQNGVCTVTSVNNQTYLKSSLVTNKYLAGHKHLLSFDYYLAANSRSANISLVAGGSETIGSVNSPNIGEWTRVNILFTLSANKGRCDFVWRGATGEEIKYANITILDLTLACPKLAADANLTVEQFEKWLALNIGTKPYYAYNAGTLLGASYRGMTALKTANLLNPSTKTARLFEYTYGDISNKYTISNLPAGSNLYFTPDNTGVESAVTLDDETHFTIPSSGILRVDTSDSVAETWLVAYWDGGMDDYSNFKPYQSNTNTIDARYIYYDDNGTKRKVWDDGVIKATGQGSTDVKDRLYVDGNDGKWKAEVNCGQKVFNGEESFSVGSFGGYPTLFQTEGIRDFLPGCAIIGSPYDKINKIISNLFTRSTCNSSDVNWVNGVKTYCYGGQYIGFRWENNDISAITSLKSWLATNYQNNTPLIMWYELATPIHHDTLYYSEDGVSFEEMNVGNFSGSIIVDNWSYEEAVVSPYENNGPTSAAPNITVEYQGDAVETINTLHDDVAQLKEDVIDLDSEKADLEYVEENFVKQGSYSQSTRVGLADNLVGEPLDVTTSYTTKATAYDETQPELEVADGPVNMTELQGRGVAWQQLSTPVASGTLRGLTITNNGNGKLTISGTAESSGNVSLTALFEVTTGHRYYIGLPINTGNYSIINTHYGSWANSSITSFISYSSVRTGGERLGINVISGDEYSGDIIINIIDLTLLNPTLAAKANLTVAEVEDYLATLQTPKPYYAQNEGQLLGARMLGWQLRKTPNLFNPTTGKATLVEYSYNEGSTDNSNKYEITGLSNLTDPVITFTPYTTGVALTVAASDGDITLTHDSTNGGDYFTIPSAGELTITGTGDKNYVCVKMVWDNSKAGKWFVYSLSDNEFDTAKIYHYNSSTEQYDQVFQDGILRATGDGSNAVRDRLFTWIDGEGKTKCGVSVNVGENVFKGNEGISFGNNNYIKSDATDFFIILDTLKTGTTKIISSKCAYSSNNIWNQDGYPNTFTINNNQLHTNIANSFTGIVQGTDTIETAKTKLNTWLTAQYNAGTPLEYWYELATPVVYTSDLYYKTGDDTYVPLEEVWPLIGQCCNWASENLVEQGDDAQGHPQSITPMTTEEFQSDMKELLKTIGDTYISKEQAKGSFNNLLTTINANCSTVIGGTLSISSETDASGNLQFEFTPNA